MEFTSQILWFPRMWWIRENSFRELKSWWPPLTLEIEAELPVGEMSVDGCMLRLHKSFQGIPTFPNLLLLHSIHPVFLHILKMSMGFLRDGTRNCSFPKQTVSWSFVFHLVIQIGLSGVLIVLMVNLRDESGSYCISLKS